MANGSFRVFLERNCEAGKPWAVRFAGVAAYPSLTVEFFGAVGGIFRYFPRGRDEMTVHFQHPDPGAAHIFIVARDARCLGQSSCQGPFTISPANGQTALRTPLRDDGDDGDDWQSKMDEIDARFSWKTASPDGVAPNRAYRGDDVDGYNAPGSYSGDDVDGYYLRNLVTLPQTGKPPFATTWNPSPITGNSAAPPSPATSAGPTSGDLSDLINSRTQDLLNRLTKR